MKSLLIITRMDYHRQPHQRFHQQVRYWGPGLERLTVLFRRTHRRGSRGHLLRALLSFGCRIAYEDTTQLVEVDPLWNLPEGVFIKGLSFLQDVADLGCMLVAFLLRVRRQFDVCIGVGPYGAVIGYVLKRLGLVKTLVYEDIDYEPGFWRGTLRRWYHVHMEQYGLQHADVRVSVGDRLAALRRSQVADAVLVIPNGVDYTCFATAQHKLPHPPTLIYTGNIAFWHSGVDLAVQAMPVILRDIPQARLLVVGAVGPYEAEALQRLIAALRLEEHVFLLGVQPYTALPQFLREADVGLAVFPPSALRSYAIPYKVFEYMAAGVAVLGTRGSETARIITEAGCGEITDFTPTAFAHTAVQLLGDRARCQYYAENGQRYSRNFDWQTLMDRELACIQAAVSRRMS